MQQPPCKKVSLALAPVCSLFLKMGLSRQDRGNNMDPEMGLKENEDASCCLRLPPLLRASFVLEAGCCFLRVASPGVDIWLLFRTWLIV